MAQKHPHAEASYAVFQQKDMTFGVRVTIPDSYPTVITSFATEALADAWVAEHRAKAASGQSIKRRPFSSFGRR